MHYKEGYYIHIKMLCITVYVNNKNMLLFLVIFMLYEVDYYCINMWFWKNLSSLGITIQTSTTWITIMNWSFQLGQDQCHVHRTNTTSTDLYKHDLTKTWQSNENMQSIFISLLSHTLYSHIDLSVRILIAWISAYLAKFLDTFQVVCVGINE
jgi:hypothetical protein